MTWLVCRNLHGLTWGRETATDETTICKFRHVLGGAGPGERLFHLVNEYLTENRLFVSKGTIVDATLIERPQPRIKRSDVTRTCT